MNKLAYSARYPKGDGDGDKTLGEEHDLAEALEVDHVGNVKLLPLPTDSMP